MKTLLVLSQVYVPDPASVGQHMADACREMVERGYRVKVVTANRGYDDASVRYPYRETIDGVQVVRVPGASLGKSSVAVRMIAGLVFVLQAFLIGILQRRLAGILVSTAPQVAPLAALGVSKVRRVPITYWLMDLNPDQMIALGRIGPNSAPARVFNSMNRLILGAADRVVVLDRFMAERIEAKTPVADKVEIIPPWPYAEQFDPVARDENRFRTEHGWTDKTVIMYSGNHGYSTPIRTILDAALLMQDRDDLVFAFIGGGVGKPEVDDLIAAERPTNIVSLPYQPLEETKYSLSAADVHIVSVGEGMVGIVHPSKIYGALSVSRPILYLGPYPSHVSDITASDDIGWDVEHGQVERAVSVINEIADLDRESLEAMGKRARGLVDERYSNQVLRGRFCDVLDSILR